MEDLNKYETAPLIELEDFQCPEGAKSFFIRGFDNKKLRVALWNINSGKGTIILQSGRTDRRIYLKGLLRCRDGLERSRPFGKNL